MAKRIVHPKIKLNASIILMELESESLQGEKLQSKLSIFINQVTSNRIKLRGRLKGIEEELRLVEKVKINVYSNLTQMKLPSGPS